MQRSGYIQFNTGTSKSYKSIHWSPSIFNSRYPIANFDTTKIIKIHWALYCLISNIICISNWCSNIFNRFQLVSKTVTVYFDTLRWINPSIVMLNENQDATKNFSLYQNAFPILNWHLIQDMLHQFAHYTFHSFSSI